MKDSTKLEKEINQKIGEVRTDTFDMSFGEIINLHENKELIIQPEYQRLFRWSIQQKSHLIESILLELPIPQIFVIENQDGVLELIDGLQRTSTVLQFVEPGLIQEKPLILEGCSLITSLNGLGFKDLPLSLRLSIKRSPIRTVVIKKQSKGFLRYEMFKRLNTGGSNLEPQEIRNCSARMVGEEGVHFYSFLVEQSNNDDFAACVDFLPDPEKEKKGAEELVLRFFATKNARELFQGSVRDWLDNYMEEVLLNKREFKYEEEKLIFEDVFRLAREKLKDTAFLRYRNNLPVGSLPPAYFEAISMGICNSRDKMRSKKPALLRNAITKLIQSKDFRDVTGPGANSRKKLDRRIELATNAIIEI
ncbi:MAG: DUF262 domain-containing protein [Candidatus Omnitrophota bacterium]